MLASVFFSHRIILTFCTARLLTIIQLQDVCLRRKKTTENVCIFDSTWMMKSVQLIYWNMCWCSKANKIEMEALSTSADICSCHGVLLQAIRATAPVINKFEHLSEHLVSRLQPFIFPPQHHLHIRCLSLVHEQHCVFCSELCNFPL